MSTTVSHLELGEFSQDPQTIFATELERQVYGVEQEFTREDVLYMELGSRAASALEIINTPEREKQTSDVHTAAELHRAVFEAKPKTKAYNLAVNAEAHFFYEHDMTPDLAVHVLSRFQGRIRSSRQNDRLLTKGEEIALAKTIEMGQAAAQKLADTEPLNDPEQRAELELTAALTKPARDRFTMSNIGLVPEFARKLSAATWTDYEDLSQEGFLALRHAVDKFDWRKGYKFSTYGMNWIKQYLPRYVSEKAKTFHISHNKVIEVNGLFNLEEELGEDPGDEARYVKSLLSAAKPLDATLNDGQPLHDVIPDPDADTERDALAQEKLAMAYACLRELPEDHKKAIALKFGLIDGKEMSLPKIAEELGVTVHVVARILKNSMNALKQSQGVIPDESAKRQITEKRSATKRAARKARNQEVRRIARENTDPEILLRRERVLKRVNDHRERKRQLEQAQCNPPVPVSKLQARSMVAAYHATLNTGA